MYQPAAFETNPSAIALALGDDVLEGADQIGDFLFAHEPNRAARRRRVYRLTSEVKPADQLPVFRIGSLLFARRSTLLQWIAEREGIGLRQR